MFKIAVNRIHFQVDTVNQLFYNTRNGLQSKSTVKEMSAVRTNKKRNFAKKYILQFPLYLYLTSICILKVLAIVSNSIRHGTSDLFWLYIFDKHTPTEMVVSVTLQTTILQLKRFQ